MNEPKWRRFEKLAYEIQKELTPESDVKFDDKIRGLDSGTERQIDISIRKKVGQYDLLIVIDCKDHSAPLDIKDLGEFVSTVRDVRANKGAIVSSSGFTEAAITFARQHGIDTFRLVDTTSTDWKVYASIPVLLERTYLKAFSLIFADFSRLPYSVVESDLRLLELFTSEGAPLGSVRDIIGRAWNTESISHGPGEYEIVLVKKGLLQRADSDVRAAVRAKVRVAREYWYGSVPVSVRGFQDEQSGGLFTRTFTTDFLEPARIEQGLASGWQKIDDPETLATRPVLTMGYSDVFPLSDDPNKDDVRT